MITDRKNKEIALDLFFQAQKISLEFNDLINYLSDRKEILDKSIVRFQEVNKLDKNIDINILTNNFKYMRPKATKKELKKYFKYLKQILKNK